MLSIMIPSRNRPNELLTPLTSLGLERYHIENIAILYQKLT